MSSEATTLGAPRPQRRSRSPWVAVGLLIGGLTATELVVTVRTQAVDRPVPAVTHGVDGRAAGPTVAGGAGSAAPSASDRPGLMPIRAMIRPASE